MATENNNLSSYDKATIPNAKNFRFGIVVSEWNSDITEGLLNGAKSTLIDCGVNSSNIKTCFVPGSFELVYGAKKMQQQHVDAVIAIGSVIKGETPHFDFISKASIDGIMNLSINSKKPIGNGILTCLNKLQAIRRSEIKGSKRKGREAAKAVISVLFSNKLKAENPAKCLTPDQ